MAALQQSGCTALYPLTSAVRIWAHTLVDLGCSMVDASIVKSDPHHLSVQLFAYSLGNTHITFSMT